MTIFRVRILPLLLLLIAGHLVSARTTGAQTLGDKASTDRKQGEMVIVKKRRHVTVAVTRGENLSKYSAIDVRPILVDPSTFPPNRSSSELGKYFEGKLRTNLQPYLMFADPQKTLVLVARILRVQSPSTFSNAVSPVTLGVPVGKNRIAVSIDLIDKSSGVVVAQIRMDGRGRTFRYASTFKKDGHSKSAFDAKAVRVRKIIDELVGNKNT